jgi:hypothetical protein
MSFYTVLRWWSVPLFLGLILQTGCFRVSGSTKALPLPERPAAMLDYYSVDGSYRGYREEITTSEGSYVVKHISVDSPVGPILIDYFQSSKPSDSLVFVFPVLGGKNIFEKHLAEYLAGSGIDAAIVNRNNEFKDPTKFDGLEEIFRKNVVRDRLAIDFFENEYGKKQFGALGISRGGINVALTAGVDSRLQHNVIVLGGTDLVNLFRDSNQGRIKKYVAAVSEAKGISKDQFFELLRAQVRTDPKHTARYIDGRKALLILGLFDRTVPFSYGMKLRDELGTPNTIFLAADHYLGFLYTQTASLIPPRLGSGLFPFPYVEEEAVSFFKKSFHQGANWRVWPFRLFQLPLNVMAELVMAVDSGVDMLIGADEQTKGLDDEDAYWTSALTEIGSADMPVVDDAAVPGT